MTRIFKIFLLWLLMAAIPVQGIAAALRSACSSEQVRTGVSESEMQADTAAVHIHHEGMSSSEMTAQSMQHPTDHSHHHKTVSCGTCGSCCAGAFAFPVTAATFPHTAKAVVEATSPFPLVTGFIPDGLERPPRQVST